MINYDDKNIETQGWIIGYRTSRMWKTLTIPQNISEHTVEMILLDLNKQYDIIYSKRKMGVYEKDNHHTKKGEFIGL